MSLLLLLVLIMLVVGLLPTWGYHSYGYGPPSVGGVILLVFVLMILTGRV